MNRASAQARRARLVALVEALPEAAAVACGEHLGLEVRNKRFGWYLVDHHGDGRLALNCKAEPGMNQILALSAPDRFHIPKYLGHQGWVGLWLDGRKVDWSEVGRILTNAYRMAAPKTLVAKLDRVDPRGTVASK